MHVTLEVYSIELILLEEKYGRRAVSKTERQKM